jgi:UDP-N-acetylmuramoyl-L-alanyl-D-glutamate--2,6-diaminopimelate ligase
MPNLSDLLYTVALLEVAGTTNRDIAQLCIDSRQVAADTLFIALSGTQTDGHQYINTAIERGATAIVCQQFPQTLLPHVSYLRVADTAKALGIIAANYYDNPSQKLSLVGITGTNGKTTTATLLYKLFTQLGYTCGLISTVEYRIGNTVYPSTHTTPDTISLNQLLANMVEQDCDFCFMEVSSHAVVQQRISGLQFAGGIFSNITHDHLDYHGTFDQYIKAKKGFFDQLPPSAFALTNTDDKRGNVMLQNTPAHKYTYALKTPADFKARILENVLSGLVLHIDGEEFYSRLIGEFNAYNLLAVYGAAILLGEAKMNVLTTLSNLSPAEGRFDTIRHPKQQIIGIIDYAHTPDALQKVLETINTTRTNNGQIITVIGCGGDRDRSKRPIMAKVACQLSDRVILSSDNPRTESPEAILQDMQAGVEPQYARKTLSIVNRREAIKTAVALAQNGDIILIAGKGHEKYQEINGIKHPFDDKEELEKAFL